MRKFIRNVFFFMVFMIGIAGGGAYYFVKVHPGATRDLQQKGHHVVMVPKGTGLHQLSEMFHREGLIEHEDLFLLTARASGFSTRIQAGEFDLPTTLSVWDFLQYLRTAKQVSYKVSIPEGQTIYQVADILVSKQLIPSREPFIDYVTSPATLARYNLGSVDADSLEGYLFPETYEFTKMDDIEKIVAKMVGEFRKRFAPEWESRAREVGLSAHEAVILASIIEKETSVGSERPLIGSVFHNRLKQGMKLQSDPTTIYGIKNFDGNLKKKDLLEWTPYNTYRVKRLPKGPICNPGTEAIRAALYPASSNVLYFVARNDGSHHFSPTYEEHSRAVIYYQKEKHVGPLPAITPKKKRRS